MEDTPSKKIQWTETEKLGFILQIVAKVGKVPWDELELPEGRTQKACQVMLDKEKQKVKKAAQGGETDHVASPAKKRKAANLEQLENEKVKKPRAARKSKAAVKAEEQDSE